MSKYKPGGLVLVKSRMNKHGVRGSIATLVRLAPTGYVVNDPYNGRYMTQTVRNGETRKVWHLQHPIHGEWLHVESSLIPINPDSDQLTEEISLELSHEL